MNKKPNRKKQITKLTEIRRTPGNRTQESIIRKQVYIEIEIGITGNKNKTNLQRVTDMCGLKYTGELTIRCGILGREEELNNHGRRVTREKFGDNGG